KGINIDADLIKIDDKKMTLAEILFSESNTRFIVEVKPENVSGFEQILKGHIFSKIGQVSNDKNLTLISKKSKVLIKENITNLQKAWQKTLQW
ncbi:MAG: AIR synthase-related protein, partial [Endomicrobiia bacterium]